MTTLINPNWPAPKNIKACTTVRSTWGGRKAHHEFTKGYYDSQNQESLKECDSLTSLLNLPNDPIWITQKHSAIAIEAIEENKEKIADASYTSHPNRVCVVMTADCLPVLVCNKKGTHVAAIHAGWRGLATGIIESTLKNLGQKPEDLLVWLGPAIGPSKFEVGKDVYDAFVNQHTESAQGFQPYKPGKWFANLYELAKIRLKNLGVSAIYGGDYCTYTQADLFFSYRREKAHTGRMASLIWIADI